MKPNGSDCIPDVSLKTTSLSEEDSCCLISLLKALGHPVRLRMIDLAHAHGGEVCVCEFEQLFTLSQPTISHHIKILREAGLLESRQDGAWVRHSVHSAAFGLLGKLLSTYSTPRESIL